MNLIHDSAICPLMRNWRYMSLGWLPIGCGNPKNRRRISRRSDNRVAPTCSVFNGRPVFPGQFGSIPYVQSRKYVKRSIRLAGKANDDEKWEDFGFKNLCEPGSPDFDDIELDDEFYKKMGMSKEEAEESQTFGPKDADPEGREFTLDDVAELDPNIPDYIKKGLAKGEMFGPPIVLLAGFRLEELPMVRHIVDAAGGQEVKVVPVKEPMLHQWVEQVVETPEPDWDQPRPEDFAMSGGWGAQRTIVFGGMGVEAQATVIELLEDGGLPPICPMAATQETKRMKLGELMADAIKYQRFRKAPENDVLNESGRMVEELPHLGRTMEETVKKRVDDVEKGLSEGLMDLKKDEDGNLRVELKRDAVERLEEMKPETVEEIEDAELEEVVEEEDFKLGDEQRRAMSRVSTKLKEIVGEGGGIKELEEWLDQQEAKEGSRMSDGVDEVIEDEVSKTISGEVSESSALEGELAPPTSGENDQEQSVETSEEASRAPEFSSESLEPVKDQESVESPGSGSESAQRTQESSRIDSTFQTMKTPRDLESGVIGDVGGVNEPVTASNETAPGENLDDLFVIDNLVDDALELDPNEQLDSEESLSMEEMMDLPLGPDSAKGEESETSAMGNGEARVSREKVSSVVTDELVEVSEKVEDKQSPESDAVPEFESAQVGKMGLDKRESPVHSETESKESGMNEEVREVVEPDRVIENEGEDDDESDKPDSSTMKRTTVPVDTVGKLEEWIKENTDEIRYDADEHSSVFSKLGLNMESDWDSEGSQDEDSRETVSSGRPQRGEKSYDELQEALRDAVRNGLNPEELKQMVDSVADGGLDPSGGRKVKSPKNGLFEKRMPSVKKASVKDRQSSTTQQQSPGMQSVTPIPVSTEGMEVVEDSTAMEPNWGDAEYNTILEDVVTDERDEGPRGDVQDVKNNAENAVIDIEEAMYEDEDEDEDDPNGSMARTLTRSELKALADRQGMKVDDLLQDMSKKGIRVRE